MPGDPVFSRLFRRGHRSALIIDQGQIGLIADRLRSSMATLIYRCPATRLKVQGWFADEAPPADAFEAVTCLACTRTHLINRSTGRVLGSDAK
jgi:hypothetical protein